jgi:hypothetical protein
MNSMNYKTAIVSINCQYTLHKSNKVNSEKTYFKLTLANTFSRNRSTPDSETSPWTQLWKLLMLIDEFGT